MWISGLVSLPPASISSTVLEGSSRDHRPDLKQCVLDLITTQDGDVPLFVRVGDGNEEG